MNKNKKWKQLSSLLVASVFLMPSLATAQSSSPSYRVEESYFGTGGNVESTSPNYRARQGGGSLGVGPGSSTNNRVESGFNTPSEPFLEAAVVGGDVDFGVLSPTAASYATSQGGACNCTFYVRSYLSSQYTVVSSSPTLTSESGATIDAKTTQGAPSSNSSVVEFGINLVANTAPAIGANPVNEPDNTFADGRAAAGYEQPNQYKYANGDVIARSPTTTGNQGIGKTNYTISYIAKPANLTPAGVYKMNQTLIVVPTF
jgi:hypothetical protein